MLVWGDLFACRNDTLDREGIYLSNQDSCYHKSTQVMMEDGTLKTLEELQVGDNLLLREDMPPEPVIIKIDHQENSLVEVLKIEYMNQEKSEVAEMIITPDHFVYLKS
jgi:hypothetical protein